MKDYERLNSNPLLMLCGCALCLALPELGVRLHLLAGHMIQLVPSHRIPSHPVASRRPSHCLSAESSSPAREATSFLRHFQVIVKTVKTVRIQKIEKRCTSPRQCAGKAHSSEHETHRWQHEMLLFES